MILLPLDKYFTLVKRIKEVQINNLFARAVIEKHVAGKIYVDNVSDPDTIYVVHPYGMSLLFGDYKNPEFNSQFKSYALNTDNSRGKHEWLQTYPREWDSVMYDLFGNLMIKSSENINNKTTGIIELNTRVNFKFNREKFYQINKAILSGNDTIVETDIQHFEKMPGSVIPLNFWDSAHDFIENEKGYTLLHNGEIASTAYSAYVHDDMLEIGIETVEKYRGLGFAEFTCRKLIDYCLERNLTPVWSCKFENTQSCKLAQKLGFEPSLMIPYYRLSK